jgi:hypothetical protein
MSACGHKADMPIASVDVRFRVPGKADVHGRMASPASVADDPSVWTGRALQAESTEWQTGLALLYPALAWSRSLLAIMDIRARPISFSDRPSKASRVTRSRTRRRDRCPSPQIQLADLGRYLLLLSGLRINRSHPFGATVARSPDAASDEADRDGGHPFGEPERAHIIPLLR